MTVLTITDRDDWTSCTDNIVVADAKAKLLTFVPRDLWIGSLQAKANAAFRLGGHSKLMAAMAEIGLPVSSSVCLTPVAIKPLIDRICVPVRVDEVMNFWYPKDRRIGITDANDAPVLDARKQIRFDPPLEVLEGERVHEWLGARISADEKGQDDLKRIVRQQILIKSLLQTRFDFTGLNLSHASFSTAGVWGDLAKVGADWKCVTYGDGRLMAEMINSQSVLVFR